jgi:selenide,water dikinase
MNEPRLTQYSRKGGCGCKIAPQFLEEILGCSFDPSRGDLILPLVGNEKRDDASVYELGNGEALISTTDFFMPIVDDPFDFGRIAAANAISDVYAMGGRPLGALAILGWPTKDLDFEFARRILAGGAETCRRAGIVIAGGHTIENAEPLFGLAVNGLAKVEHVKRNSTARAGDALILTKPLGVGIVTTALKKSVVKDEDFAGAMKAMLALNSVGRRLGELEIVHAMTDVTGFGLLGHLSEMCRGADLSAKIHFEKIPLLCDLEQYIQLGCVTGGGERNWESCAQQVVVGSEFQKKVLSDPQTSGGLLVAVESRQVAAVLSILAEELPAGSFAPIGEFAERDADQMLVFVD